jgi:HTH-type transcriptional repressor of NAD biosynthesis genes
MEKEIPRKSCFKIVLYGPESTGKTTLAKSLAKFYNTQWAPEFARDYLQKKWNQNKEACQLDDLPIIANGQIELEKKKSINANRFLFCDTNILVTKIWSETYYDGYCNPRILKLAEDLKYDYYFLTSIDTPWVKDDLRDRPNDREKMFLIFKKYLEKYRIPFTVLSGSIEERFKKAKNIIDKIL